MLADTIVTIFIVSGHELFKRAMQAGGINF